MLNNLDLKSITENTVTELWLVDQNLTAVDMKVLATALEKNTSIELLNISRNSIGDEGLITLVNSLRKLSSLRDLNISSNSIGDKGIQYFAEHMQNNYLNNLILIDNQITNRGAIALARYLRHNKTLSHIYLYSNQIGDLGGLAIMNAINSNPNSFLKTLWLDYNHFSLNGCVKIIEVFKSNLLLTNFEINLKDGDKLPLELDVIKQTQIDLNLKRQKVRTDSAVNMLQLSRMLLRMDIDLPLDILLHMITLHGTGFSDQELNLIGSVLLDRQLLGLYSHEWSDTEFLKQCLVARFQL
ncbi:hypothetical protein BC833DRAFT_569771 [Globomyces pollinis-pini]|nr:hypothetical protein BC833DRAFT_569771 [Globomyces pollinis-pini]